MKTELVFKLEKNPTGFGLIFAENCEVKIKRTEGLLYLNYENRAERVVGHFKNLRKEGELILSDIELFDKIKSIEHRLEYSIEGVVLSKNEKDEVNSIFVKGAAALMDNKF